MPSLLEYQWEPEGVRFVDKLSGKDCCLVTHGPYTAWICYKHVDGQYVTLRLATQEEIDLMYPKHPFLNPKGLEARIDLYREK